MWANYLRKYLKWVILFALTLLVYIFLRKKTILETRARIYNAARANLQSDLYSRFIVAQAAHETGNFTSSLFHNNNNCFGMKFAGQTSALGIKNGYAYYKDIEQSVYDLYRWLARRGFILANVTTLDSFVLFLKNNQYFEASYEEYLNGVRHFYFKFYPLGT